MAMETQPMDTEESALLSIPLEYPDRMLFILN